MLAASLTALAEGVEAAPALPTPANASVVLDTTGDPSRPANVSGFLGTAGTRSFFSVSTDTEGPQLWSTDGTASGTRPIASLAISDVLTTMGDLLVFVHVGSVPELWVSDGTPAGTRKLGSVPWVEEFPRASEHRVHWALFGGRLVWIDSSYDNPGGRDHLRTFDGESVSTILSSTGSLRLFPVGDRIIGERVEVGTIMRFATDGTAAGTHLLGEAERFLDRQGRAINGRWIGQSSPSHPPADFEILSARGEPELDVVLTSYSTPQPFHDYPDDGLLAPGASHVYWAATDAVDGWELWRSDGTLAGTERLTDLPDPSALETPGPARAFEVGERVAFRASNDGVEGLWTVLPGHAETLVWEGTPVNPVVFDGALYWDGEGSTVFAMHSGSSSAAPVIGCEAGCGASVGGAIELGGRLLARGPGGSIVAIENGAIARRYPSLTPIAGQWITPSRQPHRALLQDRVDDQTRVRLVLLPASLSPSATLADLGRVRHSSMPQAITASTTGDRFWFLTCEHNQTTIYSSGGTEATTQPIATPPQGHCSFTPVGVLAEAGPRAVYWTGSGPLFGLDAGGATELPWRNPRQVTGDGEIVVGEQVVQGASWLWRTDGTVGGTWTFDSFPSGRHPGRIEAAGGVAAFEVGGPAGGREIWWVDLASPNHHLLDANPGHSLLDVVHLGSQRLALISTSSDEATIVEIPNSGTPHEVATMALGSGAKLVESLSTPNGSLLVFEHFSDLLIFTWSPPGEPTLAATFSRFHPLIETPSAAAIAGPGLIVLSASDEATGAELAVSDGTAGGSYRLADIWPGVESSSPSDLVSYDDRAFFTASDGRHGRELWETDGTPDGTRLVQDLQPGPGGSQPQDLVIAGDRLYFTADDGSLGRELWSLPLDVSGCVAGERGLCLGDHHRAEIEWRDFAGNIGRGTPVPLTADSGAFWFFREENLESIVKVLDGRPLNDHEWVFFGSLTNVDFALTVTDVDTGAARRWINPSGNFASAADTEAFGPRGAGLSTAPPAGLLSPGAPGPKLVSTRLDPSKAGSVCLPSDTVLCLNGGRFAVEATWADFNGGTGVGHSRPVTDDTGALWFFREDNLEVLIKVLDGRPLTGAWWVFYGAISNVEYQLVVTDTATGVEKIYRNPSGRFASVGDTGAFPD